MVKDLQLMNVEETNNNISATLMISLPIQKSVSMKVEKSLHHMKAIQQRMSSEIYGGWWSQRKLKDHKHLGNHKSQRLLLDEQSVRNLKNQYYELHDLKNAKDKETKMQRVTPLNVF